MTAEEKKFITTGEKIKGAEQGQLFGKPCFKINGKAFICFFQNEMVFKLTEDEHEEALGLKGAKLFDPSGKKRPMKEWVQVPGTYSSSWEKFAKASLKYVKENS
ncbi:hypothetical protein WSM22_07610 [Cytophagales bacterium WSM2-2]|nr:hypothetical protein WSM22_07610 [Cytophagales bacterium WSM2-2]